jgi:hypothetical protein
MMIYRAIVFFWGRANYENRILRYHSREDVSLQTIDMNKNIISKKR